MALSRILKAQSNTRSSPCDKLTWDAARGQDDEILSSGRCGGGPAGSRGCFRRGSEDWRGGGSGRLRAGARRAPEAAVPRWRPAGLSGAHRRADEGRLPAVPRVLGRRDRKGRLRLEVGRADGRRVPGRALSTHRRPAVRRRRSRKLGLQAGIGILVSRLHDRPDLRCPFEGRDPSAGRAVPEGREGQVRLGDEQLPPLAGDRPLRGGLGSRRGDRLAPGGGPGGGREGPCPSERLGGRPRRRRQQLQLRGESHDDPPGGAPARAEQRPGARCVEGVHLGAPHRLVLRLPLPALASRRHPLRQHDGAANRLQPRRLRRDVSPARSPRAISRRAVPVVDRANARSRGSEADRLAKAETTQGGHERAVGEDPLSRSRRADARAASLPAEPVLPDARVCIHARELGRERDVRALPLRGVGGPGRRATQRRQQHVHDLQEGHPRPGQRRPALARLRRAEVHRRLGQPQQALRVRDHRPQRRPGPPRGGRSVLEDIRQVQRRRAGPPQVAAGVEQAARRQARRAGQQGASARLGDRP